MDQLREFLDAVRTLPDVTARLRGMLYVLVGRKISLPDGTVISSGMNWRAAAQLMRQARWDPEAVRQLGIGPDELPPRDREKYWYQAITRAGLATAEAAAEAREVAREVEKLGYVVNV